MGENNSPNTEKLSDILQEYINNKKVDIIDIIGISMGPAEFFIIYITAIKIDVNGLDFLILMNI